MAESSESGAVVRVQNVTKEYELGGTVTALDDVTLELPESSYTAVMGPSGSGKSTLLNLIGALDTPTSGNVTVDSRNISTLSESERAQLRGTQLGFIFQTFNLMTRLTALENATLPLVFAEWDRTQRQTRAQDLLEGVGLGDRIHHLPRELSGGQRQRVAIARALATDPTLILADEPTGNVDTETGNEIMELLAETNKRGNTILLVTHERRIAERADRIIHMTDGTITRVEETEATA
ncbi:ABC transporter ATP-binding protein [Halovenus rubra]|uniref:ABC transporter ATP-binding protein n=2 Tax=Halovenus rubra TaxID=869890 RepID=A0ACC7E181_9EURY|nr:ABC transporter ATP-binding protein [Halovenus rubra]